MSAEFSEKIILPRELDQDFKRRLNPDVVFATCEEANYPDLQRLKENYSSPCFCGEVVYDLYGKEEDNVLVCTGFYPKGYNFCIPEACFEYSLMEIMWNDPYPFLRNPGQNPYQNADYLGALHNHDTPADQAQRVSRSVRSVGLSRYSHTCDWKAFDNIVKTYGGDGRKICMLIYYSHPEADFYKGLYRTITTSAKYLDVEIK